MQDERSGARKHQRHLKGREVLSPAEAAAFDRGQAFKRYVRAAAALSGLYDDSMLADAVDIGRGAVQGWWRGSKPETPTIFRLADATGLSADELTRYLYADGPPPTLPASGPAGLQEGARRGQEPPDDEAPGMPLPSPQRPPRDGSPEPE